MKKYFASALALTITCGLSSLAMAQGLNAGGGFTGPSISGVTVAEAAKLSDDTAVILTGKIEKNLGGEKYLFSDKTGSIVVEIDNEDWNGVTVGPQDTVELRGEIDKDLMKDATVDVDTIVKK